MAGGTVNLTLRLGRRRQRRRRMLTTGSCGVCVRVCECVCVCVCVCDDQYKGYITVNVWTHTTIRKHGKVCLASSVPETHMC